MMSEGDYFFMNIAFFFFNKTQDCVPLKSLKYILFAPFYLFSRKLD